MFESCFNGEIPSRDGLLYPCMVHCQSVNCILANQIGSTITCVRNVQAVMRNDCRYNSGAHILKFGVPSCALVNRFIGTHNGVIKALEKRVCQGLFLYHFFYRLDCDARSLFSTYRTTNPVCHNRHWGLNDIRSIMF